MYAKSEVPNGTSLTQPDAAKLFGVSTRSVKSAQHVLDKALPDVAKLIEEGDVAVSLAAIQDTRIRQLRRLRRDVGAPDEPDNGPAPHVHLPPLC